MQKQLSKVHALSFILGMTLLISGTAFGFYRAYRNKLARRNANSNYHLSLIIQTGPEKLALPTQYLAELLDLSIDRPINLYQFDTAAATKKLLASPLITSARLERIKPNTLLIDYTIRTPIARLTDYTNTGVDTSGHLFPLEPYLSPKNLPLLTLGITLTEPIWGKQVDMHLANKIFSLLSQDAYVSYFPLKALDLSEVNAPSSGRRQIVLITDYATLRLSPKSYPQQLGNYLELFPSLPKDEHKIIDMRIDNLAFIDHE